MRARRTTAVVAVVAALAVGQVITSHLDVESYDYPPFVRTGATDEVVHLAYADVQVTDARPAHYLAPPISTELARMAGGVFVVVMAELTATREPTMFNQAWLVDDEGRVYRTSDKSGCTPNPTSYTGVTTYTMFCFDVPTDVLSGMHFRIARGELDTDQTRGDDIADVDLGISAADQRDWAGTAAVYGVELGGLQPFELQEITLEETP